MLVKYLEIPSCKEIHASFKIIILVKYMSKIYQRTFGLGIPVTGQSM
jgi:hypothetical protein